MNKDYLKYFDDTLNTNHIKHNYHLQRFNPGTNLDPYLHFEKTPNPTYTMVLKKSSPP